MSIGLSHIRNNTFPSTVSTCLLHVVPVTDRHLCNVIHTFTMPEFQMSTRNYEYVLRAWNPTSVCLSAWWYNCPRIKREREYFLEIS